MLEGDFGTRARAFVMRGVVLLALCAIGARLGDMQLINEAAYGKKSEDLTTRAEVVEPPRGKIFSRDGHIMVENSPAYEVSLVPSEFKRSDMPELAALLGIDTTEIVRRLKAGERISPYLPVRLKRDISPRAMYAIEEHLGEFKGVYFQSDPKRFYAGKALAAHIVGFCKEISERQIETLGDYYRPGDVVGYTGLEASYETILRGEKGYDYYSIDPVGKVLGPYDNGRLNVPARSGSDLHLCVDEGLEALAEKLLKGREGAIVALDPNNGGVLAMASSPTYNPADFSGHTTDAEWTKLAENPGKPLFNRATMSALSPGSTFKMVLAAAALQDHVVNLNWTVDCKGWMVYGDRRWHNAGDIASGVINLMTATEESNDVFYYNLMLKVGLKKWSHFGRLFGFGRKTGIDLKNENPGILPSTAYFNRLFGKDGWTKGYLLNLAIGQGELAVTPLQMAAYVAAIANDGKYYQPHLVNYVKNELTGRVYYTQYGMRRIPVSRRVFNILHEAMYLVVNGPLGTGRGARLPDIAVCGKTGTAQNSRGNCNAWFVAYAPFDHPKIALAVMVEHGGYGGAVCAPIARKLIKYYMDENGYKSGPVPESIIASRYMKAVDHSTSPSYE